MSCTFYILRLSFMYLIVIYELMTLTAEAKNSNSKKNEMLYDLSFQCNRFE